MPPNSKISNIFYEYLCFLYTYYYFIKPHCLHTKIMNKKVNIATQKYEVFMWLVTFLSAI